MLECDRQRVAKLDPGRLALSLTVLIAGCGPKNLSGDTANTEPSETSTATTGPDTGGTTIDPDSGTDDPTASATGTTGSDTPQTEDPPDPCWAAEELPRLDGPSIGGGGLSYTGDRILFNGYGAAFMFRRYPNDTAWTHTASFLPEEPDNEWSFAASTKLFGDVALVSVADRVENALPGPGALVVYMAGTEEPEAWSHRQRILPSEMATIHLAYDIAFDGHTLVLGTAGGGTVYVYRLDPEGPVPFREVQKLNAPTPGEEVLASPVALAGDLIFVGAWGPNLPARIHIFERSGLDFDSWMPSSILDWPDTDGGSSPWRLAMAGELLVAGGGHGESAVLYVFSADEESGDWSLEQRIDAPGGEREWFTFITASPRRIFAASQRTRPDETYIDIHVFERTTDAPDSWAESGRLVPSHVSPYPAVIDVSVWEESVVTTTFDAGWTECRGQGCARTTRGSGQYPIGAALLWTHLCD